MYINVPTAHINILSMCGAGRILASLFIIRKRTLASKITVNNLHKIFIKVPYNLSTGELFIHYHDQIIIIFSYYVKRRISLYSSLQYCIYRICRWTKCAIRGVLNTDISNSRQSVSQYLSCNKRGVTGSKEY